ncbi:cytochrome P450 [Mangrovimicrobium sediminis]|uniref:Cytochrome P450 n=1 Tax=Mangrovimicrobium sediminis TaxID=2562682 RepID=A0A4Z0M7W2_9GAMM|nr:cytochrome P450 [Haliea sp. SAOS-164]TGD75486.1 cytochrome P450 [Haliea sp. SAOS-164]
MSNNNNQQAPASCPVDHANLPLGEATLTDPIIHQDPFAFYRQLRAEEPIYFDPELGQYLVSRYEDVMTISQDPVTFSVKHGYEDQYAKGFFDEFREILERDGGGFFPDAIMSDPPYHTRVRKLLEAAFTAHRVKQLEPRIRAVVGQMLDELAGRGQIDAVEDFAIPMTISIICEQLGISEYDPQKIRDWSSAVTAQIGRMQDHEGMVKNAGLICELQNFLIAEIREREREPREDMISDLVHARAEDEAQPTLNFKEVVSLVRALMIAGNDTTAAALSQMMLLLATQPDLAQSLYENVDDERYVQRFVEELLRIQPPVHGLSRTTTREVVVGGKQLPEGAHLLLLYASANDDDRQFECPREFDMTRRNLGRNATFGGGVHRCIGNSLARMELKVAAQELIRRFADIRLAIAPEEIRFQPTIASRSISSLPVSYQRRQPPG